MARSLCDKEERGDDFSFGEISSVLRGVGLADQTGTVMKDVADLRWEADRALRSSHQEAMGYGAES